MKLHQKNNEYYNAFKKCLAMQGTNLKQFCNDNGLKYDTTYARLKAKWIDVEFIINLYELAEWVASVSCMVDFPFISEQDRLSISYTAKQLND